MVEVLFICDKIQEIYRLRRYFGPNYVIKATNTTAGAIDIAKSTNLQLILYHIGTDFKSLFPFYRELRDSAAAAHLHMIVMADVNILKPLTDTVYLENATIVSTSISRDALADLVSRVAG
jgi:DNA-binding NarL/FixJ family response regulator